LLYYCPVKATQLHLKISKMKKVTVTIRNQEFHPDFLCTLFTEKVCGNVEEYKKDPNCWADLWAKDSDMTESEQLAFIYAINFC